MSSPIRFGMIGAGQIAGMSINNIKRHPQGSVVAVQDPNRERVSKLCREHGIASGYSTAEEILGDPKVDAVYIAVPNKYHAPLAIQALEAGKHVVLEKPFAFNLAEAEKVAEAASKSGKAFMLGMNRRYSPEMQTLHQLVKKGRLGEVYHAKAYWFRRTGIPSLGTWFCKRELSGGGCLYDIGVHMLDMCLFAIGNFEPVSVTGTTYTKFGQRGLGEGGWGHSEKEHPEFDVDDFATALIRFRNGATVSLDVTWACHTELNNREGIEIFGTEAGARTQPFALYQYGEKPGEYSVVQNPVTELPFTPDRFHNFINHLVSGEELCVKMEEALVVQKILDGIAESAATGREVRLD